jgi:hypothetical protein
MLKKIILKADLLTINKDVLQTSFIDKVGSDLWLEIRKHLTKCLPTIFGIISF